MKSGKAWLMLECCKCCRNILIFFGHCLFMKSVFSLLVYLARSKTIITFVFQHAEKMITLLEKRTFSENGSSQLVKEKTTYIHFCDLLEELEGI